MIEAFKTTRTAGRVPVGSALADASLEGVMAHENASAKAGPYGMQIAGRDFFYVTSRQPAEASFHLTRRASEAPPPHFADHGPLVDSGPVSSR